MIRAAALAAMLAFAGGAGWAATTCSPDTVEIRGPFGEARFHVEIADDMAERALGLMNRESLPTSAGMLFIYEEAGAPAFWMKNTLIPLDMLFVTPEGVVQYIKAEAQPGDLSPVSGGEGVIAVLEIGGGLAAAIGIAPGAVLRHPAFDPALAAWPCEGQ